MHGVGFELEVNEWFDFKTPKTSIHPNYIEDCINLDPLYNTKPSARIVWLGSEPITKSFTKKKRKESWEMMELTFHSKTNIFKIEVEKKHGLWLANLLSEIRNNNQTKTLSEIKKDFETKFDEFELFWYSSAIQTLKENGLVVL